MIYYAIFIELTKDLKNIVLNEKLKFLKFSTTDLVNHPPHITLLTFTKKSDNILNKFDFKPIDLMITNKDYFFDEQKTYTLFLNIKKNQELKSLHYQSINLLNQEKNPILYEYIKSEWRPHITIGQISNFEIAENFKFEQFNLKFKVNKLSYVKFENGKHLVLQEKKYD